LKYFEDISRNYKYFVADRIITQKQTIYYSHHQQKPERKDLKK